LYLQKGKEVDQMKKVVLFFVFVIYATLSFSADKSLFDLKSKSLSKTLNGFGCVELRNDISEITMLSGGYFTIGTANGLDAGTLDDNCGITYGHPYAMTSHPIFSIDGSWYKLDEYFTDLTNIAPGILEDTVFVSALASALFSYKFALINSGNEIEFVFQMVNLDSISHSFGTGLVFDPGLGKWGDGYLELENDFLSNDTLLNTSNLSSLKIMERNAGAKGLGIEFDFSQNSPTRIIAANWQDIYTNQEPSFEPGQLRKLFDLLLKIVWKEESFEPNEEKTKKISLKLIQPDFSSSVFLRWDLNSFLSIENNMMFPKNFDTFLEISKVNGSTINNAGLELKTPIYLDAQQKEFNLSISPNSAFFQKITFKSKTIYEDKIVDASVSIKENNQVLDELHRNVFIPATPVSDTGLVVMIDTLITDQFPNLSLIFSTEITQTNRRVLDLNPDNIFLYENGLRIKDVRLEKYSSGGSTLADIVFVLDISGSMGNEIDQVRDYLGEFADSLAARGYDYQIGVVTFSTTVDNVWDFTNDIEQVKNNLATINLWGGTENSPAALYKGSELSFRAGSRRNIIWITDEAYPEHSYTKVQVVDRMLALDITVHGVGLTSLQTDWFNPIVLPTGGNFYNINGNFRDILLDVSRFESQDQYNLTFVSPIASSGTRELELKIHYAGLGGKQTYQYSQSQKSQFEKHLVCFPNPFNPEITLQIDHSNFVKADVHIYNILGQCVKHFPLTRTPLHKLVWNARSQNDVNVGSGFYIIQLSLLDKQGTFHRESEKVLYLK
jgi:Mg-chelatase subunit ChlD